MLFNERCIQFSWSEMFYMHVRMFQFATKNFQYHIQGRDVKTRPRTVVLTIPAERYSPAVLTASSNSNGNGQNSTLTQNPNPLNDYDKTLHNWLRPRDEHVTQNLCQTAVRKRLAKYVKYKDSLFILFVLDSPTEVTRGWILTHNGSNYALWRKEVPFWGSHDGRQHFRVQIPQKPSKMAFYRHVRAATNGFMTNDVIEDWRHWLRSVARSPLLAVHAAYTIYSILGITVVLYFPMIKRSATKVSADALYSVRKFSFCKVYTAFVDNLFYRLTHKKSPRAVCWKTSKTLKLRYASGWH